MIESLSEQDVAIEEIAKLCKEAIRLECTCYSLPEDPCKYCNRMMKVDKLMEELHIFQD